jgi:hypothetical protein
VDYFPIANMILSYTVCLESEDDFVEWAHYVESELASTHSNAINQMCCLSELFNFGEYQLPHL